jgi:outer membrane protein OmpA-like peptidoglycan-associated protein
VRGSTHPAISAVMVAALLLAACSGTPDPEPDRAATRTPDTSPAAEDGPDEAADPTLIDHGQVLGTATATSDAADGLELEVMQVTRLWDGAVAVSWRVINVSDGDRSASNLFGRLSAEAIAISSDGRRGLPLREESDEDERGWPVTATGAQLTAGLAAGEAAGFQAVLADPGGDTVTLETRHFTPTDVPVGMDATDAGPATIHELATDGVRLEVGPAERVGDLVAVRARLHNDGERRYNGSPARASVDHSWRNGTRVLGALGSVTLLDPATNRRHLPARDPDGLCWCDSSYTTSAGAVRDLTVILGAPDGDHVALYLPQFGTIPNLPIVDVDRWDDLTINGDPVPDLAVGGDERPRLIATVEEVEDGTVTRATTTGGDTTDVALAADVLFDVDDDQLRPDADTLLDELAARLDDLGPLDAPVIVAGHTDSTGSRAHNQDLSERRAASVAAALQQRIDREDLTFEVVGHGQDRPAVDEDTDADRQRNRRVEVHLPD